jgi:hypothetical protein
MKGLLIALVMLPIVIFSTIQFTPTAQATTIFDICKTHPVICEGLFVDRPIIDPNPCNRCPDIILNPEQIRPDRAVVIDTIPGVLSDRIVISTTQVNANGTLNATGFDPKPEPPG